MKKNLIFILLIIILGTQITAKSLKLGTDDWPPYEYYEGGKYAGYSTEIIENIFKAMNITIEENKIYPWARAEDMVYNGRLDAVYSASTSEKRRERCWIPDESLIDSPWVFMIRKEDAGKIKYESLEDLVKYKIGVVKEYSYTNELWEFLKNNKNYEEVTTDEQNLRKLDAKRIDVIVVELGSALGLSKRLGLYDKLTYLPKPIKITGLYILFGKATVEKEIADEFSAKLKKFRRTPEFKKIYEKYMK